ncbi:hypothetical protein [Candidatus Mycoplasma mahonii]|uniref:hypothetical protein n=1 Tax=Candidatus Mycoplasma mahonii TaxID=3004105 RepID=UPI0026EB1CCF|nr:hypothetical protein [Candidatus Mycoplasma mahonii]WKX02576.1 hypothetical protein O3I44_00660 [Candidatus Mycoplasma mahonii]
MQILKDIRVIIGNKSFFINRENVEFVTFAPILQRKILFKVYKGVKLIDISKGKMILLARATKKIFRLIIIFQNSKIL